MTDYLDDNLFETDQYWIDLIKRFYPTKRNNRKEGLIFHLWFFKFQDSVSNGSHDWTILCLQISDVAIITVKNVDYCCIIQNMSKSEAINLLEKVLLEDPGYIKKILS